MPSAANPTFDVREIPFSVRGSWLNVSPVVALHTRREHLHLVTHRTGMHAILRFVPSSAGLTYRATPSKLEWVDGDRIVIQAAFDGLETVRLRGRGVTLRIEDAAEGLTPFSGTYLFRDPIDGSAVFTSYESGHRYRVTAVRGSVEIQGSEALGEHERAVLVSGESWEVAIEEYEAARAPYEGAAFDAVVDATAASFTAFADAIAEWRDETTPAAELAAYVLWSATVSAGGFLRRESVLMSKHWMDKVWSWDHCFNALALAQGEPAFALDQFLVPFDHQDVTGALPDSVTHSEKLFNFVKPPIHGWAFRLLRASIDIDATDLTVIFEHLARETRFWLDHRRVPGHALPHYQHGNDSGWDNATTFDRDRVIESPDLAAFLLVQLDVVAGLADELGSDAAPWRDERALLERSLVHELWNGETFIARSAGCGRESTVGSLLTLLPIVVADRLPRDITDRLAADIQLHLTDFGLATQLVDTPEFVDDGYWRGPIWAPSTVLIEDGLRHSGHVLLADEVSARFRALCEASGFAENFDALTGLGLRDRAYTWTASAYLILSRQARERAA